MSSKRDLVEAHGYNRRRLVTAFVSGAPGGREVEPVRYGRTIIGGIVLAVMVVAGAAVSGFLQKPPPKNWDQAGLVIGKESGSRFYAYEGTLYPIINITSARLLLEEGKEPVTIGDDVIAGKRPGPTIGINGAPEVLPSPDALSDQGWTACTNTGGGIKVSLTTDPVSQPATDAALLVQSEGKQFLVAGERRLPVAGDSQGQLVLRSLGLDGVEPVDVSGLWLDLVPEGTPLPGPQLAGEGRRVDTGVPGLSEVGTPVEVDGRTFVLGADGALLQTTEFAHLVYSARRQPVELDFSDIQDLDTRPGNDAVASDWPEDAVTPYDLPGTPCVRMDASEDEAPVVQLAAPRSDDALATTSELERNVSLRSGAVVRGVSANVLDAGPVYLVDGTGTSYVVGQNSDGAGLASLGYSDYTPRPVPAAWMDLFAPGPQLSSSAAAKRPVASDQS
ncbi:type VII secretion protein EccB [Nocardioides aurantiacus]|uniref:Type VII secretion protein EccB n=1 Tax=Nocardioides aurantiacus TaxID=86796 RepID=A0A3N2CYM9_9ACTN|nr:type VII secretion protein EccB [Nocardioides aurantiacus]ROR92641.1 type VII secretion protein EccB [Nocardioides aurantiacus]